VLFANDAVDSIELAITAATAECAVLIICRRFEFCAAMSVAAVMATIVCGLKMI
jgi:hypothetical protein